MLGNNGIITKAQDAKLMSRAGSIEDEVGLWKNDTYIGRTAGLETKSKEVMLQGLKDKKLVYEEEIDRINEIITIKKKDGTIVKEIPYSDISITISKTPETEKAGAVLLKVTSVEGISTIKMDDIPLMDEETKKELIRQTECIYLNKYEGANVSTFEEAIKFEYEQGWISENSEEAFWNNINNINNWLSWNIEELPYKEETDTYYLCEIINPDNEILDSYITTENGIYTFKVKDLSNGQMVKCIRNQ